ncbi:hypothetical protein YC2023_033340 [Brassica napus]
MFSRNEEIISDARANDDMVGLKELTTISHIQEDENEKGDKVDLDMNSRWRTGWIEGSHEGCGMAFDIPDFRWCLYDSQDHQVKDFSLLLDMTHKTNDLRKCLLGYDIPRNKTSS